MEYKVLTIMQPWATLLVHGVKKIETQPKPTTWTVEKGVYLIHAASKWTKEQENICCYDPFFTELCKLGYYTRIDSKTRFTFPLGQIIGAIEVKECFEIHNNTLPAHIHIPHLPDDLIYIQEPELSFGNYEHGRSAWLCENPRILKSPIPYKGGQGYYQNFKGDKSQLIFL